MYFFFKNGIFELRKYLFQFFSCFTLIFIGITLFIGLNFASSALKQSFAEYSTKSKLYNFSTSDFHHAKWDTKNPIIQQYCPSYEDDKKNSYQCGINLLNHYEKEYNFTWDISKSEKSQSFFNDQLQMFSFKEIETNLNYVVPFFKNANYMLNNYIKNGECIVNQEWAKFNNLQVGSYFNYNGIRLKISAFGVLPYHVFKPKSPFVAPGAYGQFIVNPFTFNKIQTNSDGPLSNNSTIIYARYNSNLTDINAINKNTDNLNKLFSSLMITSHNPPFRYAYANGLNITNTNVEISSFFSLMYVNERLASIFLAILLANAGFISFIVIKRRVSTSRKKIGILKSLGYKNHEIAFWFLPFSFLSTVLGVFLGWFLGFMTQKVIINLYDINYPVSFNYISWMTTFFAIIVPIILIIGINYLASLRIISKNTVSLTREDDPANKLRIVQLVKFSFSKYSFKTRFLFSSFFKSFGKMCIIGISTLVSSFLVIFCVSASFTIDSLINTISRTNNYNFSYTFNADNGIQNINKLYSSKCLTQTSQDCSIIVNKNGQPTNENIREIQPNELLDSIEKYSQGTSEAFSELQGSYIYLSQSTRDFINSNVIKFIKNDLLTDPTINATIKNTLTKLNVYLNTLVSSKTEYIYFGFIIYNPNTDLTGISRDFDFQSDNSNANSSSFLRNSTLTSYYGSQQQIQKFLPYFSSKLSSAIDQSNTISNNEYIPAIISKRQADISKLKINQTFEVDNIEMKVVGINNDLVTSNIIISPNNMFKYLELTGNISRTQATSYMNDEFNHFGNIVLSKNLNQTYPFKSNVLNPLDIEKTNSINFFLNYDLLSKFLVSQTSELNLMIIILIIASSIISLIIVLVISNIIIEENKIIISIMKVLGYRNVEASKMFLGIYIPVMILAFLLSIVLANILLHYLTNLLSAQSTLDFSFNLNLGIILLTFLIIGFFNFVSFFSGYNLIRKLGFMRAIQTE